MKRYSMNTRESFIYLEFEWIEIQEAPSGIFEVKGNYNPHALVYLYFPGILRGSGDYTIKNGPIKILK